MVRNKARLVAQGYRQEEGIDYDEVFAPVDRIKSIRIFLAFASYMGIIVYQMDVKSAFLYGTIDEEVYVSQPPGFVDPKCPQKVYKVVKALYGLHQAPRAWYATLSTFLLKSGYRRGTIDKTLFIKKDKNDIMLVQVYVDGIIFGSTKRSWCDEFEALMKEILKKFDFASVKTASTPIETQKPLVKDEEATDVDVHLYRSMIGSLMYLTASRPDIMFAVCACSRFQVTLKTSHLNVVKRIFRYLNGKPKLGLWYPRVSSFDLEAYSDSDYARANINRKSTTGGCQFLGRRLILWQCKKQTIMATSTTEAEYVDAVNCCGQNPVFHSKTKHIEIRHHFIRDAYEKKLIQVLKIHTDDNVADLLTKAFDKNLDNGDVFHRVIWVLENNWRELPSSSIPIPDSNPEGSGGNHGGQSSSDRSLLGNEDGLTLQSVYDLCISLCTQATAQVAEFKDLKTHIKQLKKKAIPIINHHKAWFRADMLKKQQKKKDMEKTKKDMEKSKKRRSVSKQGRKAVKSSKGAPSVKTNTDWDDLDTDLEDYTLAQDKGKTDFKVEEPKTSSKTKELHLLGDTLVVEDKGSAEKGGSTKGIDLQQSIVKPDEGTDKQNGGTDRTKVSTDSFVEGTAEIKDQVSGESDTLTVLTMTSTPTPTVFGDDETIAQVLVTMSQNKVKQKEKEKGVELKNVEDIERPRPTSTRSVLTLKPLPKIDLKAKGK
ncbi:putative ribonuclease H-like domain-containing protein [Tanacetum coccineum]